MTDDEIKKLIDFTVEQQKAQYDESLLNLEAVDNNAVDNTVIDEVAGDVDSEEELYQQVLEFVVRTQKASASLLQRRFRLGYNRAARAMDLLEERGIVGPPNGSKPREVLVKKENQEE